ncbi:ribose-5-phosphate isomerase RpiA [Flavobacteriaceae bacterium F89]|uniref:Ribose-5-phosphate isomerase A n=1 Tax=Cerina litoralis TaxID=2874477 RepID=A0AAE3JR06_9FLAO|nr:ribose-5-phosphate isomerase RpiA [Cerina litoralis]MCG2462706.1 ribose-5-phosphate isomerase RpiA [Cerina litoralis]
MSQENEKRSAAIEAVKLIRSGMTIGLGSGSTAAYMIQELGKKIANGLKIRGVTSSKNTEKLAIEARIPLIALHEAKIVDINIDGADEFDPYMQLIKGGGGALLREKIVAYNSKCNVVIADSTKEVPRLGKFKLPIETIPFATGNIIDLLAKERLKPQLRKAGNDLYITDENNYIVDLDILGFTNLAQLEERLLKIPGIVETGLFLETTHKIIVGHGSSTKTIDR